MDTIKKMKAIDVTKVKQEELVDIRDVRVNGKLSQDKRLADYVAQIKNPYCYKYGDYIVKLRFEDTDVTLTDRLREVVLKIANMP